MVPAVGNEEAFLGVERKRMGGPELSRRRADLPPLFDVLPVLRELDDASRCAFGWIVVLAAVSVRDENVAVRRSDHVTWLVEGVGPATGNPGAFPTSSAPHHRD